MEEEEENLNPLELLKVVRRRWIIFTAVGVTVVGLAWVRSFMLTPIYSGAFELLIQPQESNDLTTLPGDTNSLNSAEEYETTINILKSPQLINPVVEALRQDYPQLSFLEILENLTISRLDNTKIILIQYQSENPLQIKQVLDSLASIYISYSIQTYQNSIRQGIEFVESQIAAKDQQVKSLETELQALQEAYRFIDPLLRQQELTDQLATINQEIQAIGEKFITTQRRYQELQSLTGAAIALRTDPQFQQRLEEAKALEEKISLESTRFQENSPVIQALRDKQASLLPLISQDANQAMGVQLDAVIQDLADIDQQQISLLNQRNNLEQQLKQLPVIARTFGEIQRELETARNSLNRLLSARESLQLDGAKQEVPWQLLVAPTVPSVPISPNLPRNLIGGLIFGLVAGTGAALLRDRFDDVFNSLDDLRGVYNLPILGAVPTNDALKNDRHKLFYGSPLFVEALRLLANNLYLLSSDLKSLVISSPSAGDGKTTISINLAQATAIREKRVLLVDMDLRYPKIHQRLSLDNSQGLSNLLASEMDPESVIQPSGMEENLFILTAGDIPPDPSRLLSSSRMDRVNQILQDSYDLVIYDMPPILGISDANIMIPKTDGVILAVKIMKTRRTALQQTITELKTYKSRILGLVANDVQESKIHGYYSYYDRPADAKRDPSDQKPLTGLDESLKTENP